MTGVRFITLLFVYLAIHIAGSLVWACLKGVFAGVREYIKEARDA